MLTLLARSNTFLPRKWSVFFQLTSRSTHKPLCPHQTIDTPTHLFIPTSFADFRQGLLHLLNTIYRPRLSNLNRNCSTPKHLLPANAFNELKAISSSAHQNLQNGVSDQTFVYFSPITVIGLLGDADSSCAPCASFPMLDSHSVIQNIQICPSHPITSYISQISDPP